MVQWLGLGAFTAVAQVQSLVGELRSCKPCGATKKKKKKFLYPPNPPDPETPPSLVGRNRNFGQFFTIFLMS